METGNPKLFCKQFRNIAICSRLAEVGQQRKNTVNWAAIK